MHHEKLLIYSIIWTKGKTFAKKNKVNFTFDCWCILWLNDCNASSQKKQTQKMSCSHGYRLLVSSSELRGLSHWIYILVCFSVGRMQSNRCMQWYVGIGWSILGLSSSPPPPKKTQTHKNQTYPGVWSIKPDMEIRH